MSIEKIINYLVEDTSTKIPELFHISFRDNLSGMWTPKNPAGNNHSIKSNLSEPKTPRISCSSSIIKCFYAIYPNISKYFEENMYPHMNFIVYSPVLNGNEKIWTPEYLTKQKLVHDAYMTDEYCILQKVHILKIGELIVYNPLIKNKHPKEIEYRPFNNPKFGKRFLCYEVDYKFKKYK